MAIQLHLEAHKCFPCSWPNGDYQTIWGRSLLPYLEEGNLGAQVNPAVDLFAGNNLNVVATPIAIMKCPTSPSEATYPYTYNGSLLTYGTTDYKGVEGVSGDDPLFALWNRKVWVPGVIGRTSVYLRQVTDGTSQTVTLVESVGGLSLYGPDFRVRGQIWWHSDGSWAGRSLAGLLSPTSTGAALGLRACSVNCLNQYGRPAVQLSSRRRAGHGCRRQRPFYSGRYRCLSARLPLLVRRQSGTRFLVIESDACSPLCANVLLRRCTRARFFPPLWR